jgi:hypothetical protein|tara:strand:+ start:180 stop:704 length:525 start_codon:yes stop_codon:yes gene_type:complete
MAFDISAFKSNLTAGGARPNLFEAVVNNPINAAADSTFRFVCRAAQLPGSTIPAIDVPYFGRQVRIAGNRTFEPWTVTIINDENFSVRNTLEQWMANINSHEANIQLAAQTAYKSDSEVKHYAKDGSTIATYRFYGLFPTELGAIELSWDANDQIEEYTVTFAYDYWNHDGVTT